MASRNPSISSDAQQPDDECIFRFQLAYDNLKKVDLPVPDVWMRVVDKSSVLVASLDAKITNTRALLFRSKLPRSLYKCVLGLKSEFLIVYNDSHSGYAFDLTSTTKTTLRRDDKVAFFPSQFGLHRRASATPLNPRFRRKRRRRCSSGASASRPSTPTTPCAGPTLDACPFTVQRCYDNINVLCHRRPLADSTATQALPEMPSDVYEPARCRDGVVMPIHALPSTSPVQQELCFSTVFPVSREQLDAVQLFLSNAIASSYDQDAVLSASLRISLSPRSAGDGAKVDNDDETSSDASSDADNNGASAAE